MLHRHRNCGHDIEPVLTCRACGEELRPREVDVRAGPGIGDEAATKKCGSPTKKSLVVCLSH